MKQTFKENKIIQNIDTNYLKYAKDDLSAVFKDFA